MTTPNPDVVEAVAKELRTKWLSDAEDAYNCARLAIATLRSHGWTAPDEWEEAPDAMTGEMKYRRRTEGGTE